MHYERAPRFRRSKLDAAPPPLRYAVQGFAPLRRLRISVHGRKKVQEGIGRSVEEWHFTLGKDKRWHE
jgi:hypothetical protein